MVLGQTVAMVLAGLVGLSLGALGSGGSIITIPLLVYVAGVPAESAVGMSLVIVGTTSLLGALLHMKNGNVALKPSVLFAVTGMVGSFIGSYGTHLVSRRTLMLLFASIMLIVGIRMWRTKVGDFAYRDIQRSAMSFNWPCGWHADGIPRYRGRVSHCSSACSLCRVGLDAWPPEHPLPLSL